MIINDAVIPFHVKDTPILRDGCQGLKYIVGIKNIYIVGSEDPKIEDTIFINENEIKNFCSLKEIKTTWNKNNPNVSYRSGWLFQQFLKLGANEYIPSLSENYLICDSDIIIVNNPYQNIEEGIYAYSKAYCGQYHVPYKEQYKKMMKKEDLAKFSFINHHMIFNKTCVEKLKKYISETNNLNWDQSILNTLNWNEKSNFSEYDLYGNWMYENFSNISKEIQFKIIDIDHKPNSDELIDFKNKGFHIVSSQEYRRY